MTELRQILIFLAAFLIVAVASNQISKVFLRIRLPLVTGLLVIGIIAGPDLLGLISSDAVKNLAFINDFALAYIAIAVGSELHFEEMRSRFKSIAYMTVSQMVIIFIICSAGVYILSGLIPFLNNLHIADRIAVSILVATIFIARSPASAIAVINELRAKGPFTQTVLGVSVLKEFFVIVIFTLTFTAAVTLVNETPLSADFIGDIAIELAMALVLGWLFGKLMELIMGISVHSRIKIALILLMGFGIFRLCYFIRDLTEKNFFAQIHIEPLLVCIIGSLLMTNRGKHRPEFLKTLKEAGTPVYVVFFTMIGATISLDVVSRWWTVALILTGIRLVSIIAAAFTGGVLAGDPMKFNKIAWAGYVSPAGVSIGLTAIIATEFQGWGKDLASIVMAVIILNQLIGPPLLKWAIIHLGESHIRTGRAFSATQGFSVLFGIENQSVALAMQLINNGWKVRLVSVGNTANEIVSSGIETARINQINSDTLKQVGVDMAESIVAMLSDDENFRICEIAYEKFGISEIIVRLNQRNNFTRFQRLGVKIVEPSTAIVSLLDHYVRSPQTTSLLLGMQEGQDTLEIDVNNPDFYGLALRDLRLPQDIIILSVTRGGLMIISHGYTRLRKGDVLTMVGSKKSLEEVKRKFGR